MKIKEIHLFIKGAERAFPGRFRPCGGNHRQLCFRMNALHMARDRERLEGPGPHTLGMCLGSSQEEPRRRTGC